MSKCQNDIFLTTEHTEQKHGNNEYRTRNVEVPERYIFNHGTHGTRTVYFKSPKTENQKEKILWPQKY